MFTCVWCQESITPREVGWAVVACMPHGWGLEWEHQACAVRSVPGSVAHQEGRCTCAGGSATDDEGLTRRQAAEAAVRCWERHQRR